MLLTEERRQDTGFFLNIPPILGGRKGTQPFLPPAKIFQSQMKKECKPETAQSSVPDGCGLSQGGKTNRALLATLRGEVQGPARPPPEPRAGSCQLQTLDAKGPQCGPALGPGEALPCEDPSTGQGPGSPNGAQAPPDIQMQQLTRVRGVSMEAVASSGRSERLDLGLPSAGAWAPRARRERPGSALDPLEGHSRPVSPSAHRGFGQKTAEARCCRRRLPATGTIPPQVPDLSAPRLTLPGPRDTEEPWVGLGLGLLSSSELPLLPPHTYHPATVPSEDRLWPPH